MQRRIALAALLAALPLLNCGKQLPVLKTGGDFELTDHDGHPFRLASLHGKAVMIFFGYTSCPDACPTTLSKLSAVQRRLGSDAKRVKTLYISVDPGRDTPAVLKADLGAFQLDALGLTGTEDQIDKVVAQYGAEYQIIPTPSSAMKYTVAHTTTLYVLDAAGRVRMEFPYEATSDQIVNGLHDVLAASL